jgi:hypothetical protein
MKSRNQREGRYIPGWCHNPAYKKGSNPLDPKTMKAKPRTGAHYDLRAYRDPVLGNTFFRTYRQGAFE